MILLVYVKPNAKRTQYISWQNNVLTLKLAAPPIDGKANQKLLEELSELFDVPKNRITLIAGHTSKQKRLSIDAAEAFILDKIKTRLANQPGQTSLL